MPATIKLGDSPPPSDIFTAVSPLEPDPENTWVVQLATDDTGDTLTEAFSIRYTTDVSFNSPHIEIEISPSDEDVKSALERVLRQRGFTITFPGQLRDDSDWEGAIISHSSLSTGARLWRANVGAPVISAIRNANRHPDAHKNPDISFSDFDIFGALTRPPVEIKEVAAADMRSLVEWRPLAYLCAVADEISSVIANGIVQVLREPRSSAQHLGDSLFSRHILSELPEIQMSFFSGMLAVALRELVISPPNPSDILSKLADTLNPVWEYVGIKYECWGEYTTRTLSSTVESSRKSILTFVINKIHASRQYPD